MQISTNYENLRNYEIYKILILYELRLTCFQTFVLSYLFVVRRENKRQSTLQQSGLP